MARGAISNLHIQVSQRCFGYHAVHSRCMWRRSPSTTRWIPRNRPAAPQGCRIPGWLRSGFYAAAAARPPLQPDCAMRVQQRMDGLRWHLQYCMRSAAFASAPRCHVEAGSLAMHVRRSEHGAASYLPGGSSVWRGIPAACCRCLRRCTSSTTPGTWSIFCKPLGRPQIKVRAAGVSCCASYSTRNTRAACCAAAGSLNANR